MEDSNKILFQILNERLDLLRTLDKEGDSDRRRHVARETQELHAPLAHRLGLYQIKTEMEDLALKFLEYDTYKYIARALELKKTERESYIKRFIDPLSEKLTAAGFSFTIKGRPKSIHSIYHKMQQQHCDVDRIYDLFAIRIILDSEPEKEKSDCWQVYSMITDIFTPNPKRLRDWLSVPKENGYESLHTTVLGPDNKWVEVQIRTRRMDEVAEKGVAAHWAYKGVNGNILASGHDVVFVFTPTGDLKKLPAGATVLDFAFSIHSDVGCHCVGGRIRNQNVSIRQKLENGDQVEIMTSPNQHPTASWLNDVVSSKAKNKIRQALKAEEYKQAAEGREILERRFRNWKIDLTEGDLSHMALKLGYKMVSDLYQSIANGKVDVLSLKDLYEQVQNPVPTIRPTQSDAPAADTTRTMGTAPTGVAIVVDINGKVDYHLSPCCNPQPGDPIFGFISVTKGIRIHRCDCPNALNMQDRFPYRMIPARWAK